MSMWIRNPKTKKTVKVPETTLRKLKIRSHKGWKDLDYELNPNQVQRLLKEIGAM